MLLMVNIELYFSALYLIYNYCKGTTIYTDGWASYRKLTDCGHEYKVCFYLLPGHLLTFDAYKSCFLCTQSYNFFTHLYFQWDWVNHSKNFVKPGNKNVHTQRIESQWYRIKR